MKKPDQKEKNKRRMAVASLLTSLLVIGCASQSRSPMTGLTNTLNSPKFNFLIVNYPSTDSDSSEGNLYARVRYDDLIFVKMDSSYTAHYELSVNLYSNKMMTESSYSKTFDRKLSVLRYSQTMSNRRYDELSDTIIVEPGHYFVDLRLLDLNTNVTSSKEIEYDFKDFSRDSISVSDVVVFDSSDTTPVQSVKSHEVSAGMYVTSKVVPTKIPLHLVAKSTEAPTSIDTIYELNQTSRVQYYRLAMNVSRLEVAVYDLRVTAGKDFAETAFRIMPNGISRGSVELSSETGPLAYIMTQEKFDSLKSASTEQREKILEDFWLGRSRNDTSVSEAMQKEFYRRVEAADEQFGTPLVTGWRTDRGRIYILYGKPDRIEDHVSNFRAGPAADSPPYEVWYYTSLRLRFVFVDELRDGNYRLVKSSGT